MRELINKMFESSIDFPMPDLDPKIWDKSKEGSYSLKPNVKKRIIDILNKHTELGMQVGLIDIASVDQDGNKNIHITGSIGTNQYKDDTDVDVHIILSKDSKYFNNEEFQEKVNNWFKDNMDKLDLYIEGRPIEVYIQFNPAQEYLSAACYNMFSDKWLKGPKLVPEDYDPYEDFSGIFDNLRTEVKDADLLFGELKRDIIDYEFISQAMKKMPKDLKKSFLDKSKAKLQEIENDVKELYQVRKHLINTRKLASQPSSKEQALSDEQLKKVWGNKNAQFKFIARYQYLKIIKELEKLLDDETGELSNKDVEKAKDIVGLEV